MPTEIQVKTKRPVIDRQGFAKAASMLHHGWQHEGLPYEPNAGDDRNWVIDQGNDYRIRFKDEHRKNTSITLVYRYSDPKKLEELKVRLSPMLDFEP